MPDNDQQDQLTQAETLQVDAALMSPSEWQDAWLAMADETGIVVDPALAEKEAEAEAAKLRKAGQFDRAMEAVLRAKFRQVDVPRKPGYQDLNQRQKVEALRRGMEPMRPRPK
jgi:hypothetical protein